MQNYEQIDLKLMIPLKGYLKRLYNSFYGLLSRIDNIDEKDLFPYIGKFMRILGVTIAFSDFPVKKIRNHITVGPDLLVINLDGYFSSFSPISFIEVEKPSYSFSQHTYDQIIKMHSVLRTPSILIPTFVEDFDKVSKVITNSILVNGILRKMPLNILLIGINRIKLPSQEFCLAIRNICFRKDIFDSKDFKKVMTHRTWIYYINIIALIEFYNYFSAISNILLPVKVYLKVKALSDLLRIGDALNPLIYEIDMVIQEKLETLLFKDIEKFIEKVLEAIFYPEKDKFEDVVIMHPLDVLVQEFKRSYEGSNILEIIRRKILRKIELMIKMKYS